MKKGMIVMLIFISTLLLSGCNENQAIKIVSPLGAVGISHAQIFAENININNQKYVFESSEGTQGLSAYFANGKADIILAPVNLGIKFYHENSRYLFGGTITWGNILFATGSLTTDFTINDLENKKIYTFGEGSVPYIIVQYIIDQFDINATIENIGDSTLATQQKLISDPNAIVMIAEPALSAAIAKLKTDLDFNNIKVLDIQELYSELHHDSYPQAGLFIKKSLVEKKPDFVREYLLALKISTDFLNENPTKAAEYAISSLAYTTPKPILISSIPKFNSDFKTAEESRNQLDQLMNIILAYTPASISGLKPNEGFYLNI